MRIQIKWNKPKKGREYNSQPIDPKLKKDILNAMSLTAHVKKQHVKH